MRGRTTRSSGRLLEATPFLRFVSRVFITRLRVMKKTLSVFGCREHSWCAVAACCRRDRALEAESGKSMLRAMCVTNCNVLWIGAAPVLIMAWKRFTSLSRSMRLPPTHKHTLTL
ncbi:unnamed protein product, partial [Ectocarpus sp. 12 AP-2014]